MSKAVNLKNISVIKIERTKTILNFMNSIKIENSKTPDYVYIKSKNTVDFLLSKLYINSNFLFTNSNKILVNKNAINNINFKEDKNIIIFNLNYSITSGNSEIANSVFWELNSKEEFVAAIQYINKKLSNDEFASI